MPGLSSQAKEKVFSHEHISYCFKVKMALGFITTFLIFSWAAVTFASDPSPLQDFCVAVDDSMASGKCMFNFFIFGYFAWLSYLHWSWAQLVFIPYALCLDHILADVHRQNTSCNYFSTYLYLVEPCHQVTHTLFSSFSIICSLNVHFI